MKKRIVTGDRLPNVALARLASGTVKEVVLEAMLAERRAVIVGIVGAFTPICTQDHALEFIANADRLRTMGYDTIVCIAPNDPWTLAAWQASLGETRGVEFLSDGNLDLARALGVTMLARDPRLGERPRRYLLLTRNNTIERMTVEPDGTGVTCTAPSAVEAA